MLPLKSLFVSSELRHLVVLELEYMRVEEKELSGLLSLCAATLKSLQLQEVHLYRGTWLSLFQELKGRFLRRTTDSLPTRSMETGLGLFLLRLRESGPEVSSLHHYKDITLAGFPVSGRTENVIRINHVRDWLIGRAELNPYWIESTGASRSEPFGLVEGYRPLYAPGYDGDQQCSSTKEASEV